MEKVTYHELRLINACKRRREYPLHLRSADSHPKQLSAIQKAILSDVLSERMESGEIPDRLHELLKEMPFRSKKGKNYWRAISANAFIAVQTRSTDEKMPQTIGLS